ncbi:MAG: MBL fold metallo-hydrolase [Myxococcales bacterium]|nr:MBL fold metallo-hydrolase [Myxococcales bacterium]
MLRSMRIIDRIGLLFAGLFLGCGVAETTDTAMFVDSPTMIDPQAALAIHMVDVGQGDGMIIKTPSGLTIALDGGPDRSGSYADYLKMLNVTRVDYVILSHGHSDHYTGLGTAIGLLPKDCEARVFDPGFARPDIAGYQYIRDTAGCRYRSLTMNQSLLLDPKLDIQILGVTNTPYPQNDSAGINNTSAMIKLRYGKFSMLFTGDAQTESEKNLYMNFPAQLPANVLKIGHHGSCNATGTSLLKAVAPSYAIISSGGPSDPSNFGHPHCQTLGKLRANGVHYYRTDQNGDILVISDGNLFSLSPGRGAPDSSACPRACAQPTDF